ncbi:GIY-YIG nuclease family protein [Henriciella aquimarina]|uniref:GIY-YIG nuclease family protein n=1 Tax=Henriciella aquimarina TaxID=545261 RepID=UPI000A06B245|nr:hypothetical protein [Henriciella aquimarina]
MSVISDIRKTLHAARGPWFAKDHTGSGFYAIYLKANADLPFIGLPEDRLLYIGMTQSGFSERDHFEPKRGHSGGCTLRRSLGAILKYRLNLSARRRSAGASQTAYTHYRFDPRGEQTLSEWMQGALYLARVPFGENVDLAEARLIRAFTPPLNLTGWANPQAELIKRFRRECMNEARHWSDRATQAA